MKILVNGLPYFSKKFVDDLNAFDSENHYLYLNTYYSLWARIKFFILLPFYDKVISMNGVSSPSGSMDLVLKHKKPLMMIWQGTDVVNALKRQQKKTIERKYITHAKHFAISWLAEELKSINVEAEEFSFLWLDSIEEDLKIPKTFAVLTYLGKNREYFYGWEYILAAAKEFKDIIFHVVGTEGEGLESEKNIVFHGWVKKSKMHELFAETSVYVRMTEHDGNAHLIAEALSLGLDVVWTYPHPQGFYAKDKESLKNHLQDLKKRFYEHKGTRNKDNIAWVKDNLKKEVVLSEVLMKIKAI